MFSSRLEWGLEQNEVARRLEGRRDLVLDLTESNPTHAGFDYPVSVMEALGDERALRYEPTAFGLLTAREAVSRYYEGRVSPDRIALSASTSEAYSWLFKLLTDPGDEVLVPRPSYPLFEYLARLENVRVVQYPLFYDHGWHVDVAALEALVTERSRAIVVVNPNNPTGSYLKRGELSALIRIANEHGLALIADEVFWDYGFAPDASRVSGLNSECLSFSMSGLSKLVGLPQMKLGWIAVDGPAKLVADALHRLELIADTYLSAGTPVQVALPRLLELGGGVRSQICERTASNLIWLRDRTKPLEVEGGWCATIQVPRVRTEEEWVVELLDKENVLVQPGYFYDFESEAFLVLSLLTEPSIFRQGVERIASRVGV